MARSKQGKDPERTYRDADAADRVAGAVGAARQQLGKALTRSRLAAERHRMPWMAVGRVRVRRAGGS